MDVCLPPASFKGKGEKEALHNKSFFLGWGNAVDYIGFLLSLTVHSWMKGNLPAAWESMLYNILTLWLELF